MAANTWWSDTPATTSATSDDVPLQPMNTNSLNPSTYNNTTTNSGNYGNQPTTRFPSSRSPSPNRGGVGGAGGSTLAIPGYDPNSVATSNATSSYNVGSHGSNHTVNGSNHGGNGSNYIDDNDVSNHGTNHHGGRDISPYHGTREAPIHNYSTNTDDTTNHYHHHDPDDDGIPDWSTYHRNHTYNMVDRNTYKRNMSIAKGFMDISLLSANSNQLRNLISFGNYQDTTYYILMTGLLSSIVLQLVTGIILIVTERWNINKVKEQDKSNRLNNTTVCLVFFTLVINVLVSSFGVDVMRQHRTPRLGPGQLPTS